MAKINYYSLDGKLQHEYELEKSLLDNLQSLMCRVYLKNGNTVDGYTSTEELFSKNILKLWTQEFDVVEEVEVNFDDIERVDVLLSSHPMYGHKMMNKFEFEFDSDKKLDNNEKHYYIYVEYIDMLGDRMYCYTSDDKTIKRDDYVLVERNNHEVPAKVINTTYYTDDEAPYPYSKIKHIIKKYPEDYKFYVDQEDDYYDDEDYGFCSYIGINENEYIKFELNSFLIGKYEYYLYRATKNGIITEEQKLYKAGLSDENFNLLLDKIKENNIDRWDRKYIDNTILDGETWHLEINTKNIKLKSSGTNAYPKNYETFITLLDINGVPIDEYYVLEDDKENNTNILNLLTKEQIKILEKYKIPYNVGTKKELLINIDDVMTDYLDEKDEPTEDFLIIEKLYDEIYRLIPSDVTNEDEQEFISYYDKDVIIVLNDFKTISGHCETITRKEDSDYNDPELTIATKDGSICVEYSDVLLIISELTRIKTQEGRIGTVMAIYTNTNGMEVEFDNIAPQTETIDIVDVREVLNNKKENREKETLKYNKLSKKDFLKLDEKDIMFITNPGRMGDEDGITFILKRENEFIVYRVDGWMYNGNKIKEDDYISLDDARKQFPKWYEAWEHGEDKDYKEKYKHIYMGFGNGLNIDISLYDEFKPYLDKKVEENLFKYDKEEQESMKYAAVFNTWEAAFIKMVKDKNYKLK